MAQVQLLVTASAAAFKDRIDQEDDPLGLLDLPSFGAGELGVRGLAMSASMLAGLGPNDLEAIRDAGDKARCPILLLVEDQPLGLADPDPTVRRESIERVARLSRAAGMLGSAQLGLSIAGDDGDEAFELAASTVRDAMQTIDRFEVGILLSSRDGVTGDPARLTDLIKKIGGFRIGSLPDFRFAHDSKDFEGTLRRLAPYAGSIQATLGSSLRGGKPATASRDQTPYDLLAGLEAVLAVGYQHAICLDHAGGANAVAAMVDARERIEAHLAPVEAEDEPGDLDDVAPDAAAAEEAS